MSNYSNEGMGEVNPSPSFKPGSEDQNNVGGSYTYNESNVDSTNVNASATTSTPTKISVWTKIKDFLLQDITDVRLTEREQRFVNFWTQEVTIDKVYNFLFQEIKFK